MFAKRLDVFVNLLSFCISISLVSTALSRLPQRSQQSSLASSTKPLIFESKHPYDNDQDIYIVIKVPNAVKLSIIFDPQSSTG